MPARCSCGKQASFNCAGEKATWCSICKSPNMVDVKSITCITRNMKQAYFNYDGEKAKYCATC